MSNAIPFGKPSRNVPLEKQLPANPDAEKSVLGAILLDAKIPNPTLRAVTEILHSSDFFDSHHERIFRAMIKLADADKPIDLVTLGEQLRGDNELEAAGGDPYLAHLVDGVPRVSNLQYYAGIVREKSLLRSLITKLYNIEQRAFEGEEHQGLIAEVSEYTKYSRRMNYQGLVTVGGRELLLKTLAPRKHVIEPLLTGKGLGMIFAQRGGGKTFITLQMAYCVAGGVEECFMWRIPERSRVVYVDGELGEQLLQERWNTIVRANNGEPPTDEEIRFITWDNQKDEVPPNINTVAGRGRIEDTLQPGTLLILDNLSALSPSAMEKESEDWAKIQQWFLALRAHGIAVVFVHHAGWNAEHSRGASNREDALEFVLKLRKPVDKNPADDLRTEIYLDKLRGPRMKSSYSQPFEVSLGTDQHGGPAWFTKPLRDLLKARAAGMFASGMKVSDVAFELGIGRYSAQRWYKKWKAGSLPASESPEGDES